MGFSVAHLGRCGRLLVFALSVLATMPRALLAGDDYTYMVGLAAERTVLTPEHPSTRITVYAGVFGLTEANFGPCNFIGDVSLSIGSAVGTLSSAGSNHAVHPFSDGPISEVVTNDPGQLTITAIDAFRNLDTVSPPPPGFGPAPHGANTLVPVYSFILTLTDLSQQTIHVSVTGHGCRITQWGYQAGLNAWIPVGTPALDDNTAALDLMVVPACTDWFDGYGIPGNGINGTVYAMTVFDDGSGPALYVGGNFTIALPPPAPAIVGIARRTAFGWAPWAPASTPSPPSPSSTTDPGRTSTPVDSSEQ